MIGTSIARYDILEELGQGGMSVVYLARDRALNRKVALKVLHEHLARSASNRERFRREAKATARLQHPNILDVYDVSDESDERSFIVMEYVPGMNLREFIDRHPCPPPEAAALIGVEICNALSHAHRHGIIHRDLKPENVMVSNEGEVKLMDFGIAHVIDFETMTKTGSLLGSPAHMAPEIIDGEGVDERADIFSLGTVLYWMITGRLPFCGQNAPQVIRNVMQGRYDAPELVEPTISHDLSRIIRRALDTDPEGRFASADKVKRELLAAVHALGFDESDRMVRRYFADPEGVVEAFDAEIVPRLIARGKRAVERRNVSAAIAHFNRVLAYDPQNEEVEACLDELDRNRRLTRAALVVAALATVALLGWLTSTTLEEPSAPAGGQEAGRAVEEGLARANTAREAAASVEPRSRTARRVADQKVTQIAARTAARRVDATARAVGEARDNSRRKVGAAGRAAAPVEPVEMPDDGDDGDEREEAASDDSDKKDDEPKTHTVGFRIYPPSATLSIDGEEVDMWYKGVELAEGTHTIEVEAPGCEPLRDEIDVDGSHDEKIPIVLDWKPAHIEIVSNKKALIFVGDDSNVHSRGVENTVSVDFAREQPPSRKVQLRIADKENPRVVERRELTVRPGEEHTLNVNF